VKHKILKLWISELPEQKDSLEVIYLLPELLILQLKARGQLCICLSGKNSFPFLPLQPIDSSQGKLLWTRLKNASLDSIKLSENDRILSLAFTHKDIYGEVSSYRLIAELMPPKPNVILIGTENRIIDALHKYSYADNAQRQVLPNLPYQAPKTAFNPDDDSAIPILPEGCMSWNEHFVMIYRKLLSDPAEADGLKHSIAILNKELKKLNKKLALQKQDLASAEKGDFWLACAEALKPGLASLKQGQTSFRAINYLDPNLPEIEIELQPDKSPKDNLKLYLKKYHKAKNGLEIIKENISRTETEVTKITALQDRISKGETINLDHTSKNSVKQLLSRVDATDKLLSLRLGDEYQIVIGRKAKENDFISTQLGKANDYWFHSRIYHGAHVLLRCFKKQIPNDELLELCCRLAAGYSKAKHSLNVPVDYTQIRYVRKPRKSAPGFVTYTNFKSVYANPIDLRQARELLCIK
jgi:predicted ribosome quality control (RQC) complex YloA/Tae2 family protein